MSTQPAESPQLPYWQLPATKYDAAKVLLPLLLGLAWAGITIWFKVDAQAHDLESAKTAIVQFRDAKEDRGTRLSVVEKTVSDMHEEQKEMARDIKTILREMPKGGK